MSQGVVELLAALGLVSKKWKKRHMVRVTVVGGERDLLTPGSRFTLLKYRQKYVKFTLAWKIVVERTLYFPL